MLFGVFLFFNSTDCSEIQNVYMKLIIGEIMIPQSTQKSEQVFSKLPDYGYSQKVAEAIWQWYHPSCKIIAVHSF